MNKQLQFTRRIFLQTLGTAAAAAAGLVPTRWAFAAEPLKIWTIGVAKVGAEPGTGGKDWSAMEAQAGIEIAYNAKSGSADQAIQKMVVGDGNKLYDAITDNGGGMEDALASQNAIVPIDTSRVKNWGNLVALYDEGGQADGTVRYDGKTYAVPYISNADSLAFNYDVIGEELTSWEPLFDSQFRGRASLQNDFGPTLTNTAIYLKESGKQDIENPSDMTPEEVEGVARFLIGLKKKGQFRTFWDGFQNGVDLLASEEVLLSSCWEPVQIVAAKKSGSDIRYGTMKEGHQTWNNVWMFTKGGRSRGMDDAFYRLMNVYLSPWFGARTLLTFGFGPQMKGVVEHARSSGEFTAEMIGTIAHRLERKRERYAVKGNSWQNVFPKNIRAYQEWWARVQAA
ncbi:MAG: spermidine/putrescine ABC transporter substrate-binding protein [Gammaproteobacteria bacterium]|nr:spermidine/putrescine ABC transporter substrate-binding protein [Gammaproteobacteria bacterium]NIR84989.1 spermidine/putrescine ABC transporter substrate-binding protein [Gammaproteobacteria bacterium]NIR88256.1 spermidine/putrescine ABC transporter substrate-binding protein [Gammaproteobacteria bacterium]NIU06036.1 spermidine/putrescine ABC transporter substrate-binding protein [Gammaproteobacteria bacterium]NIV73455.1 spermidine/putrescine ABC transporter substrate-binding protein [Gammapr